MGRKPAKTEFDPQAFLAKVGAGKTILEIERNRHVFEEGDVADTVFYIQKGRVKLTVLSEQGKEAVVGILEPGQFFGEGCLNGHSWRIATTTAMEECVLTSITKEAMIATLHAEPKFSELFVPPAQTVCAIFEHAVVLPKLLLLPILTTHTNDRRPIQTSQGR